MIKHILTLAISLTIAFSCTAENITIRAVDRPAHEVFRNVIEQTYLNFIYPSDLLTDMTVNINVKNKPLKKVLKQIFRDTDITYKIKGRNVILKRKKRSPKSKR